MSDALRDELEAMVRGAGVPGCAIAMTDAAGRATRWFIQHACLEPRRPSSASACFHLFSGTKVYTAAAVMLLVERGLLTLDDPITKHLPELELRHPITIRQLASHQSGLPETLRAFLSVHPSADAALSTSAALARYDVSGGRPPGRSLRYRNVNYAILGELVSRVSGSPYERFVCDELLSALGSDAAFACPAGAEEAVGYIPRWSPMRLALRIVLPEVSRWIEAGVSEGFVALHGFGLDSAAIGGLVGTVDGFLPMLREMLSSEDGVLSAASKAEMLTVHARGAAGIVSREGVGLAWKHGRASATTFWNHEGGGPGFCSETRLYPSEGLGMVILMNRSQSAGLSRVCHGICERLRAAGTHAHLPQ